jgi:uncharacterized protein
VAIGFGQLVGAGSGHLLALDASGFFVDVGRGLREAFFMFWETVWALALGFGLSGAVQAFVSRSQMRAKLGDHGAAAVTRASVLGLVSSSCSYAAVAMARSLFRKGADFVTSTVFMFASTNLVIELGIVMIVLLGWQFAVSEFVGGVIMIVMLALAGALFLGGDAVDEARGRVEHSGSPDADHVHGTEGAWDRQPLSRRIRSARGWAEASTYTMSDVNMLRREMTIGYVVAGFLAVLVPVHVWNDVFVHGHGFLTTLENVVVGPFIAMIAFVCSVGNVPLAAALWKGGIGFGGVVSFIFGDLITIPILLIYRKYYGGRLTLRMLVVFWTVMSAAGLVTEGIFRAAGLVPTKRPTRIVPDHFSWNYTSILDIVFLIAFGVLYWTYRHRDRFLRPAGAPRTT